MPKAPTPPRSSAAGGLVKLGDPGGLDPDPEDEADDPPVAPDPAADDEPEEPAEGLLPDEALAEVAEPLRLAFVEPGARVEELLPVFGTPALEAAAEVPPPGFSPTLSALRSIVTDGLPAPEDGELPVPEADADPLPAGPDARGLPLPDGVELPEDLSSVAIFSPPEPYRFQGLHYTRLFTERYRRGKEIFALQ